MRINDRRTDDECLPACNGTGAKLALLRNVAVVWLVQLPCASQNCPVNFLRWSFNAILNITVDRLFLDVGNVKNCPVPYSALFPSAQRPPYRIRSTYLIQRANGVFSSDRSALKCDAELVVEAPSGRNGFGATVDVNVQTRHSCRHIWKPGVPEGDRDEGNFWGPRRPKCVEESSRGGVGIHCHASFDEYEIVPDLHLLEVGVALEGLGGDQFPLSIWRQCSGGRKGGVGQAISIRVVFKVFLALMVIVLSLSSVTNVDTTKFGVLLNGVR